MATDPRAAQDFYGEVLGWTYGSAALGGDFSVAVADGSPVGGIGTLSPGHGTESASRTAVAWIPCFAVDDADATAALVRERSATVAVGPLSMRGGRAALAADQQGAAFAFWEGRTARDWSVGRGSAPAHLELRTRDAFAGAIFYGEVLGWASGKSSIGVQYEDGRVMVRDGSRAVASLHGGSIEAAPDPQVRSHWRVHFRVTDVDLAAQAATGAGGFVIAPPATTRNGREATLRDPEGGLFTVTLG
jgi:predicted enzyme related to lactoylglutathione lyase